MYTGILHTHTLVVTIFLVLYFVKTILLLIGQDEVLKKVTKITKVPEMIVSTLFLGTGIYLLTASGNVTWMVYVKIALVLASIPLAIVGFKRSNKMLASLSLVLLLVGYGLAEMNKKRLVKRLPEQTLAGNASAGGKEIYTQYCQNCHGEKGNAGMSGAKDLTISTLTAEEKKQLIMKGKGAMPAYTIFDQNEMNSLVEYVESLKVK